MCSAAVSFLRLYKFLPDLLVGCFKPSLRCKIIPMKDVSLAGILLLYWRFHSRIFERYGLTLDVTLHQSYISVNSSTSNVLLVSDISVRPVRSDQAHRDGFSFYRAVWKATSSQRCVVLVKMAAEPFRSQHFIDMYVFNHCNNNYY